MTEQDPDRSAILAVVQDYLDGMVFADAEKLSRALHPRFFCIGNFQGGLEWDSREAFIAGVIANAAPPADGTYYSEVLSVDVTADTAVVKVMDDYLGMRFTDTLSLLKLERGWVVVNKLFHHHAG
jgi:hypothetical protein